MQKEKMELKSECLSKNLMASFLYKQSLFLGNNFQLKFIIQ